MSRSIAWIVWGALLLPAAALPAPILLDNFNEGKTVNALEGATGAWYDPDDPSIFCKTDFDGKVFLGASGKSLRLEYNIESNREKINVPSNESTAVPSGKSLQAFNGYYSVFEPKDLSKHNFVCFWVKGDPEQGYPRSFKVEVKDGLASYYSGYKVTGINDRWQKIVIPLRSFAEVKDWKAIKEFVIVFSADSVNRLQGVINIDDVYFAESAEQNFSVPFEPVAVPRSKTAVEVDGKVIKDWARAVWRDMSGGEYLEQGARGGKSDAGLRYAAQWDDQALYMALNVTDNEIVNTENGDGVFKNDVLEIVINPKGREFDWGDASVFHLSFSPTSAAGTPMQWALFQRGPLGEKDVRAQWNQPRNTLEVAVPWSYLKVTPGINRDFGFGVSFHDRDVNDPTPECRLTEGISNLGKVRTRVGRMVLK